MIFSRALQAFLLLAPLVLFAHPVCAQSAARSIAQPPADQPLTMPGYIAELDHCSAVLHNPQRNSDTFRQLRLSLPQQWTVQAGNQRYTVDTDWLANGLAVLGGNPRPDSPLLSQLETRVAVLRDAAEGFNQSASSQDLGQSRATLDRVLSAREFRGAHGPSWFDIMRGRLYAWIGRQLEKLLDHLGISRSLGNVLAWVFVAVAALLLAIWAVRYFVHQAAQPGMHLAGSSRPGQDWRDWLREARAAAERGDYRAAIHAAYWVAVARLEETKLLPQDRSRTPRESLRLVRRESSEYTPLAQLTRRFELVWYGYRPATEADWSEAIQQLEKLGCLRVSTPAIAAS